MKVYNIKTLTEAKANKITKAWEPYKTYGTLAMWESLND
jgi:3-methyladenine DNA glycosylase/8-oxoguanine DNA glycosylase